ncbi:MAG: hypothetical protein ABI193_14255, partial [Minicystis sp.]
MALAPVEHESGSSTSDGASDDLDSLLREVARLPDARLPDVDPDRIVEQIAELRIPSQEAATPPSTSSRLRGLMTKVTHLGVDPALPRHETKHIVLTNQFALFVGAVSFAALIG